MFRRPNGTVENKLVWYMVYSVKNTGRTLVPVEQKDGVYTEQVGKGGPIRFIPSFVLQSQDRQANGEHIDKEYLDRLIPSAYDAIRARESHDHPLLNSAQMATQLIPVSDERADRSVWGYVTWVDIDPRIDFFSIFVGGLTNAYQWTDPAGAYKTGDEPATGPSNSSARCCSSISGGPATNSARMKPPSATALPAAKPDSTTCSKGLPTAGSTARLDGLRQTAGRSRRFLTHLAREFSHGT